MHRAIHPLAWWVWALGAAIAVSLVHNPLLVVLVLAATWAVVVGRRTRAPWARAAGAYLVMAAVVVVIRLVFQVIVGVDRSGRVLFSLPRLRLPAWAAGIRLGGPVSLDALLLTGYDALRLAGMLLCVGAANALANPRRALRAVPAALYQVSVAVVVALSAAPQMVESVQRVRRARRLRGGSATGWRAVKAVLVPVMEDAIERSMALAAGMESRGYGRTREGRRVGWPTTVMLVGAMLLVTNGLFLALQFESRWPWALLALGAALSVVCFRVSGRRLGVTRYRPDVWGLREWAVASSGVVAVMCTIMLNRHWETDMYTSASPPAWPVLSLPMLLLVAVVASPLLTTPAPPKDAA